ncbi:hypothetical protein M2459_003467 [Parabacteroides sp. PF5-5]|uniref:DUF4270 family protein n=1 Tax=unclassified Parabacteroides TaxID=2649774 RepID=UPI002474B140|nr:MULTISPECIES: DUF4270 family protein [unclassified Parabacteroides]MDH6306906.1 hypothetical protein [Parabacteroides sp. PH5-39]MDH6317706.1 hypothetical protein [Parabacteroides sp. PF5-13]MDH6321707.1 hypothetical protein [Parabacteroides sp. PH5-13]MDH6325293.1 hypothetical protein [Parabacteroides sp. PH5-8]MDH6328891.1 hypothetical protein [Parabacteroides sp. PH5-41]
MYKHLSIVILLLTAGLLASCYDENNSYGDSLVESVFRNVSVDTCTVRLASISVDSLETSGKEVALVGCYGHPVWGTVSAAAFIPYNRPSYNLDSDESVRLDSLMLQISPNRYFLGDTTQQLRLNIYALTQKIILNSNGYLYNHNSVTYSSEPLGTYTFKPKPNDTTLIEIRLSDELGKDLLQKFHARDQAVSSDRFEDYFKGIAIVPEGDANQSLLGFSLADTSASLSLRYRIADELENSQELMFWPKTSDQFNHITQDRSGTRMESYPAKGAVIPSDSLDNMALLAGGMGWYTRVEFPYLNNLRTQGEQVLVEAAYLKIYPAKGTYSTYNPLPENIYLYIADENNVITNAVTDYLGEEVQAGTLLKNDTYDDETYYYFDITDFIKEEMGAEGMYKHNLQLVFDTDGYTKTINNLLIGDQQSKNPIVLQLVYKIYESY